MKLLVLAGLLTIAGVLATCGAPASNTNTPAGSKEMTAAAGSLPAVTPTSQPAPSPVATVAEVSSAYTSLATKSCKTLKQSKEGDGYIEQQCPGIGGYKLNVSDNCALQRSK